MLQFYATKKLREKLPLDTNGLLPNAGRCPWLCQREPMEANPLSGWHANLLTLQRRQCVLMLHNSTRFPVFMPGLIKADLAAFNDRFVDTFMNTLLKCGATDHHMQAAHEYLRPLQATAPCSRSVLGTLNQMQGDAESMIWHDNLNVAEITGYRIGAWLADTPCHIKGMTKDCLWPKRAMLALLEGVAAPITLAESPTPPTTKPDPSFSNVVSMQDFRRRKS